MTLERAREIFSSNGLEPGDEALERLTSYERLLLEWNSKVNLVSRRDTSEVFVRQIVGSIAFLFLRRLEDGTRLLDAGTGGGLPGIPLAILHPRIGFTLADSIRKKITAVDDIVSRLDLPNVRAVCSRVEELEPARSGTFDYIAARGVSDSSGMLGWCRRLLRVDAGMRSGARPPVEDQREPIRPGSCIFLKGGDLGPEVEELRRRAGGAAVEVHDLSIRGFESQFTGKKVILLSP